MDHFETCNFQVGVLTESQRINLHIYRLFSIPADPFSEFFHDYASTLPRATSSCISYERYGELVFHPQALPLLQVADPLFIVEKTTS